MRGENSTEVMAFGKRCLNSGGMRKPCLAGSPTEPRPKEPALARNTYTHYTKELLHSKHFLREHENIA